MPNCAKGCRVGRTCCGKRVDEKRVGGKAGCGRLLNWKELLVSHDDMVTHTGGGGGCWPKLLLVNDRGRPAPPVLLAVAALAHVVAVNTPISFTISCQKRTLIRAAEELT